MSIPTPNLRSTGLGQQSRSRPPSGEEFIFVYHGREQVLPPALVIILPSMILDLFGPVQARRRRWRLSSSYLASVFNQIVDEAMRRDAAQYLVCQDDILPHSDSDGHSKRAHELLAVIKKHGFTVPEKWGVYSLASAVLPASAIRDFQWDILVCDEEAMQHLSGSQRTAVLAAVGLVGVARRMSPYHSYALRYRKGMGQTTLEIPNRRGLEGLQLLLGTEYAATAMCKSSKYLLGTLDEHAPCTDKALQYALLSPGKVPTVGYPAHCHGFEF
ncbi:hypothetical protein BJ165DRAFT_1408226 [Panaeolus papilionaceus]|nr:hypothetical protein BJ165DRAFT_1408226 [Panaeolus papilionaceus]